MELGMVLQGVGVLVALGALLRSRRSIALSALALIPPALTALAVYGYIKHGTD
jgi:hypothetical protein